jgi:hypothetical protein
MLANALSQLPSGAAAPKFREVILAAPDIDAGVRSGGAFHKMNFSCKLIPIQGVGDPPSGHYQFTRVKSNGLDPSLVTALIHAYHVTKCHFPSVKRRRV